MVRVNAQFSIHFAVLVQHPLHTVLKPVGGGHLVPGMDLSTSTVGNRVDFKIVCCILFWFGCLLPTRHSGRNRTWSPRLLPQFYCSADVGAPRYRDNLHRCHATARGIFANLGPLQPHQSVALYQFITYHFSLRLFNPTFSPPRCHTATTCTLCALATSTLTSAATVLAPVAPSTRWLPHYYPCHPHHRRRHPPPQQQLLLFPHRQLLLLHPSPLQICCRFHPRDIRFSLPAPPFSPCHLPSVCIQPVLSMCMARDTVPHGDLPTCATWISKSSSVTSTFLSCCPRKQSSWHSTTYTVKRLCGLFCTTIITLLVLFVIPTSFGLPSSTSTSALQRL